MDSFTHPGGPEVEGALWRLYRDFFDQAEHRRRWNLRDDIPWSQCNKDLDPAIADVVESFCVVELYLPDYLTHAMPRSRQSRGQAWFYANWGYEESKHSLAQSDWLLRSGHRSEEQMADLEKEVFAHRWNLPHDDYVAMIAYAMVQERATALTYRNLRRRTPECGGDPALERLLMLLAVDEQAHYAFFRDCIRLYLHCDPDGTREQLRRVMNGFAMPALHMLADGRARVSRIKELAVFDEDQYFREVYLPVLADLGITRAEMRNRLPSRKSVVAEV
jgi:acyl-[acyl-carrier-protein] desaturase